MPIKTKVTKKSVEKFLAGVKPAEKRVEAEALAALMARASGEKPSLWSNGMVGYGLYHYQSERSSQAGDWPLTAFALRSNGLTVYIMPGFEEQKALLAKLGPHRTGKSCLYIKRLSDVDQKILERLVRESVREMRRRYPGQGL